jgi:DNA (cytosine-5)-methyltransferase 1
MRPRLLDLFCGAGGAAMGYHRAGFDVVGVDIEPQPHYPFPFYQADALEFLALLIGGAWDAIHASPPCQAFSVATQHARNRHDDLLTPTRQLLNRTRLPWVIENVPGAPMRADYRLCGCMFGLGRLRRERWFETSWRGFDLRPPCQHPEPAITITTKGQPNRTGYADEAAVALGIDWMTMRERGLAIPPAYTEYVGRRLMAAITSEPAAS